MATLLIIDDEKDLRETLSELFTMVGHKVIEAIDGFDGLEKVKESKPDLIVCDVMMPKLDGYGFLEHLKLTDYSNTPLIFITARTEISDQEKGILLGARAYIIKPFSFQELRWVVEYNLENK
jgi:DNA-binding response OmpR family regulator